MSREVLSNFGISGSEDPSEKLARERPELIARIRAMAENADQQAKVLTTEPKPETPTVSLTTGDLRAKPYDPNDPKTKLGQRVLPPERD